MEKENKFLKRIFLFFIFLIPFFLGSFDLFYPFIFLAILITIFSFFLCLQIENKKIKFFIPINFLIFTIFLSLNFLYTSNFFETRNEFLKNLIYFFTFFLLLNLFRKEDLNTILETLFLSSIFVSIYGLIFYFLLEDPAYLIYSTFFNPNCLANYLIMTIPVSYLLFKEEKKILKKNRIFCGILIVFVTLILTGSRGAILSLFISFIVFFFLKREFFKDRSIIISLILIFLISLGILFTKPVLKEKTVNFFNFHHRSQLFRFLVWKGTLKIIAENIFLGTGYGTFKIVYPKYKLGGSNTLMTHNIYLQIPAEIGMLGLFFFLFLLISNFKKDILKENKSQLILVSIFSFLLHNFFEYSYYLPANGCIFWILIGCLNLKNKESIFFEEIKIKEFQKIFLYIFLISASFLFNTYILKIAIGNFYYEKGKNFEYEKKYPQAEKNYRIAIYLDPSDKYLAAIANVLTINGRYKEAEKFYKKAIEISKSSPYYHYELGIVYFKQGNLKKAEEEFKKEISIYPFFTSPHKELGDIYLLTGRISLAEKEFEKIIKQKKNPYNQEKYQPIPNRKENPDLSYAEERLKLIKEIKKALKL